jgi:hypothetical protein
MGVCKALAITRETDGLSVLAGPFFLEPPSEVPALASGVRIGISKAAKIHALPPANERPPVLLSKPTRTALFVTFGPMRIGNVGGQGALAFGRDGHGLAFRHVDDVSRAGGHGD